MIISSQLVSKLEVQETVETLTVAHLLIQQQDNYLNKASLSESKNETLEALANILLIRQIGNYFNACSHRVVSGTLEAETVNTLIQQECKHFNQTHPSSTR